MESTVDTGRSDTGQAGEAPANEAARASGLSQQRARVRPKWRAFGARPFLRRLRRPLAIVLLVLGCISVPVSVVAVWTRAQLMNTDAYVATVGPLADEPAVQRVVADAMTTQLFAQLKLEEQLQGLLPGFLGFLSGPAVAQVETWARGEALKIVSSRQFRTVWVTANRATHRTFVNFVNQSGKLELGPDGALMLDLTPLTDELVARLRAAGVPIVGGIIGSLVPARLPLVQSDALVATREGILALNRLFILLSILTLLFLIGSVLLAFERRRALMYAGVGVAVMMALFEVVLVLARSTYLGVADGAGIPHDASVALWRVLTFYLRASSRSIFFLGVVIVIIAALVKVLRGNSVPALAQRAAAAGWDLGPAALWVARYRKAISIGVLVLGFVVLIAWTDPTPLVLLIIAIVVVVLVAAVLFVSSQSALVAGTGVAPDGAVAVPETNVVTVRREGEDT